LKSLIKEKRKIFKNMKNRKISQKDILTMDSSKSRKKSCEIKNQNNQKAHNINSVKVSN
jgi:hypothetical protein